MSLKVCGALELNSNGRALTHPWTGPKLQLRNISRRDFCRVTGALD
jgi:hypothetical protein